MKKSIGKQNGWIGCIGMGLLAAVLAGSVPSFADHGEGHHDGYTAEVHEDWEHDWYDSHDHHYYLSGGELTDAVDEIEIDWISGEVEIAYYSGDTVIFSEQANLKLEEDTVMCYYMDGKTLHIQFARSSKHNFKNLQKTLTVSLPEDLKLKALSLDTVSADGSIDRIAAKKVELDTTSGTWKLDGMCISEELEWDSVSGKLEAELTGTLKNFSMDTTSGDAKVTAENIRSLEMDSVSADATLALSAAPEELEWDSTSGNLTLILPEDAGFTMEFDEDVAELWGDVKCELEMEQSGRRIICGDGHGEYRFETVSGDLKIQKEK